MKKWKVIVEADNPEDYKYFSSAEYTVKAETLREARDKGRPAPGWHIRSIKEITDEEAEVPR